MHRQKRDASFIGFVGMTDEISSRLQRVMMMSPASAVAMFRADPQVLMLILDDSGRRYSFANFEAWLEAVRR